MRAALDYFAALEDQNLIGAANGREAVAMTKVVRPRRSVRNPSWIIASLSLSRLDVASSRIKNFRISQSARAMAMRCRWPPESLTPRSPTIVS